MKLDAIRFGLAAGIIWAGAVLTLGILDALSGWGAGMVKGIGSLYLGYTPTKVGVLVGTVWAFFDAGIGGLIFALIYNWLVGMKK